MIRSIRLPQKEEEIDHLEIQRYRTEGGSPDNKAYSPVTDVSCLTTGISPRVVTSTAGTFDHISQLACRCPKPLSCAQRLWVVSGV